MKKLLSISALCIIIVTSIATLTSCGENRAKSYLTVEILQQPKGGVNVRTVSAMYKVTYTADPVRGRELPPTPITLSTWWTNDKGGDYNKTEEEFSLESPGGTYTTAFSAPVGMSLDKTFWLKFDWSNTSEGGGGGDIESAKAVFTVKYQ